MTQDSCSLWVCIFGISISGDILGELINMPKASQYIWFLLSHKSIITGGINSNTLICITLFPFEDCKHQKSCCYCCSIKIMSTLNNMGQQGKYLKPGTGNLLLLLLRPEFPCEQLIEALTCYWCLQTGLWWESSRKEFSLLPGLQNRLEGLPPVPSASGGWGGGQAVTFGFYVCRRFRRILVKATCQHGQTWGWRQSLSFPWGNPPVAPSQSPHPTLLHHVWSSNYGHRCKAPGNPP